jgi:energy-coupling factor transporter ATP-binding protein EcfA2
MTPDLMEQGAQRFEKIAPVIAAGQTESGGRSAGYGRIHTPGTVDITHGRILYLEDVHVSFDGFKAINGLSLDIAPGELRCIIGPNGAGKTTMMDIITGKTKPDSGQVFFGSTIDLLRYREAEIAALLDTPRFIERAREIYGYANFVCDSGGSICEVVDAADPGDPVMRALADNLLLVWIKGSEAHRDELIRRFDRAPKPIYYQPDFLATLWAEYLAQEGKPEDQVDPDAFLRFGYARILNHRQPRYAAMAEWGVTVTAEEVAQVSNPGDFHDLISRALDRRAAAA